MPHNDSYTISIDVPQALYYPSLGKSNLKFKSKLAIFFFLCVLFVFFIIGVELALAIVPIHRSHTVITDHSSKLVTTTEFQITLKNYIATNEWKDRASMMKNWMKYFEEASDYFTLEESTMENRSRTQFYVDMYNCGSSHLVRVRNIVDGFKEGSSTIDIKANSRSESEARGLPFWPSPKYLGSSIQKCERDEHYCGHKYSRETRITLDYFKSIEYCVDIVEIFPFAFGNLPATSLFNPITPGREEAWFEQQYTGYLDNNTQYKAAFTIKYDNIDDAINNHNPNSGEWSIRLYSLDRGASSEFNEDVKKDVTKAWRALIGKYAPEKCFLVNIF